MPEETNNLQYFIDMEVLCAGYDSVYDLESIRETKKLYYQASIRYAAYKEQQAKRAGFEEGKLEQQDFTARLLGSNESRIYLRFGISDRNPYKPREKGGEDELRNSI